MQDAYIRWNRAKRRSDLADDASFIQTTVTRLCLDRLRSARARREVYVGQWLPEPIVEYLSSDPEAATTLADDVSVALLLALERLSPLERATFLLHEAMGVPLAEVAKMLDRSEPAIRQLPWHLKFQMGK